MCQKALSVMTACVSSGLLHRKEVSAGLQIIVSWHGYKEIDLSRWIRKCILKQEYATLFNFCVFIADEEYEDGIERTCDTLLMCIVTVLNQGLRNGGGVGDVLRRPSKDVSCGGSTVFQEARNPFFKNLS